MNERGKKVFVGMSGGVDSAVSAALLKEQGYDVTGVFLQVWQPDFLTCTRGDDRQEAMRAAAHIGIPFITMDVEREYKEAVVEYMISEYAKGRTPNPDVMCNKHVKFGVFYDKAMGMGADYVATGHYARVIEELVSDAPEKRHVRYSLRRGKDTNKDQSYFLWTLTSDKLAHILFPVGEYEKPRVRERARKFGLPNAERKDSQGVCFMGQFSMEDFLKHYIEPKRGEVLNEAGEVIGWHEGAAFFTLGKRHGFTITKKTPDDAPYYVVAKDMKRNAITVAHEAAEAGFAVNEVVLEQVNVVSGEALEDGFACMAQVRYRGTPVACRVFVADHTTVRVVFDTPQEAVAAGQSVVLYGGEVCLGGGVIARTIC